jgi:hypothetical protein
MTRAAPVKLATCLVPFLLVVLLALTGSSTHAASRLSTRTDLIYGSEIGEWLSNGGPAVVESSGVPARIRTAHVRTVRYSVYDCFKGMRCGQDRHRGTVARSDFDTAVRGITRTDKAVLWLKMVPVTNDTINGVHGSEFCPNWRGPGTVNLPMYKAVVAEVKAAGYTGPLVIESNNEMEFACWHRWRSEGAPITSAGSVGVSKRIGKHYAGNMPALKAYARNLGFTDLMVGGYIGVGGGVEWGQPCRPDARKPYGFACGYQNRWMSEFNTAVHTAYLNHGRNPDYVPDFEAIHAYPHSPDFSATPGYRFNDNIAYAYYRNWVVRSRAVVDGVWGPAIGDGVRFAISEWNAGSSNSDGTWSGWRTPGEPGAFYAGWFRMLRGNGKTTGAGTAYWAANLWVAASEPDNGDSRYYNIIHQNGTVPPWYWTFKDYATGVR